MARAPRAIVGGLEQGTVPHDAGSERVHLHGQHAGVEPHSEPAPAAHPLSRARRRVRRADTRLLTAHPRRAPRLTAGNLQGLLAHALLRGPGGVLLRARAIPEIPGAGLALIRCEYWLLSNHEGGTSGIWRRKQLRGAAAGRSPRRQVP